MIFFLLEIYFLKLDLTNGQSSPPSEDNPEGYSSTKQPESYCNLCERSFCNKYFLKTHFAKKHGVLNIISPSSSSTELNQSPSPPILSTDQPLPLIVNQKITEDYCEVCSIKYLKKKNFFFPLFLDLSKTFL